MRFFQKVIYYLCYLFYKITMRVCHDEIKALWYRNSFCFNYWVFLKSDIDITCVFKKPGRKLIQRILETHSYFRRYFPVIGEMVIFSEAHKESLLACGNIYELRRDPELMKKYEVNKSEDFYEKVIFLHKFIAANWSKNDLAKTRPEKIQFVMNHLGLNKAEKLLDLIDELSSMIGAESEAFKASYINELNNRDNNLVYFDFNISNVIYVLFYNNLCYLKPPEALSIAEKKILEKSLEWELWGAFSYQASLDKDELEMHFMRLFGGLETLLDRPQTERFLALAKDLTLP